MPDPYQAGRMSYHIRIHRTLLQRLNSNKNIIIQTKDLDQVSTLGLQLLLNFVLNVKRKGMEVTWPEPSPELIHAANILGIKDLLGLPEIH